MRFRHTCRAAVAACAGLILTATAAHAAVPDLPATQQAVVTTGGAGPHAVQLQTVPVRQPGPGQVLIRVDAASINAADWHQLEQQAGAAAAMRIPGLDVAGTIAALGPQVSGLAVGMPVFAIVGPVGGGLNGGYAQYVLANARVTSPKPPRLTFAEASGLGVAGATALRALDETQIRSGQRLLITGIAGGVGSSAAQIAIARGVRVLGTASPRHAAFLAHLGVAKIIDYSKGDIAGLAGPVDAVLDTVGGSEALQALRAVKPGGYFVSIARAPIDAAQCAAAHVHCAGSPGHAADTPHPDMLRVGQLAQEGKLEVHVDRIYPLARAAEALEYAAHGHTEGKVILAVTSRARQR